MRSGSRRTWPTDADIEPPDPGGPMFFAMSAMPRYLAGCVDGSGTSWTGDAGRACAGDAGRGCADGAGVTTTVVGGFMYP